MAKKSTQIKKKDAAGAVTPPKLSWACNGKTLIYEIEDGKRGVSPHWVDRTDPRVTSVRPLLFQKLYKAVPAGNKKTPAGKQSFCNIIESKQDDPAIDNFFIRGDNLLALAPIKQLAEAIPGFQGFKCAYYDVPYNTDQTFKHYDDSLHHAEWLTMMRDRLMLTTALIRDDGCIIVQVDDREHHYMKILLDEIFGRNNFINQVCYERSGAAGIGQGGVFLNTAEYILIYCKDPAQFTYNELTQTEPLELETMKRYNKVLTGTGTKTLVDEFLSKSTNQPVKIYRHTGYSIKPISLRNFAQRKDEIQTAYCDHFSSIFRTTNPQAENEFQHDLISRMDTGLYSVAYTPSRGKYKDRLTTIYYHNKEIVAWLKDSAFIDGDQIVKSNKMSTIWLHGDIPKADLANEGGVELKRSKKPEQLMKRLFDFATNEGDHILDIFAGSGTSFAVAHKMNRKWIGCEVGRHAETHILERMKKVISGADQSGISKAINWKGGGAFRYFQLGPAPAPTKKSKQRLG